MGSIRLIEPAMRNITITLDEQTAAWARVHAAEQDMSLSRFIGEALRKQMRESREYQEAMQRYLGSKVVIRLQPGERLPSRAEVNDRTALRERHGAR
jgi:hypothetical protein